MITASDFLKWCTVFGVPINIPGPLNYKGTWDANANVPELESGVGNPGDFYLVSVAGNTNLDGNTNWQVGQAPAFNGTVWQKLSFDNNTYVVGPNGATNNAVAIYDGTTGKLVKNSLVTIDALGNVSATNLFDWNNPITGAGVQDLVAFQGYISNSEDPTGYTLTNGVGDYPLGCMLGVAGGQAPGWEITIPSGMAVLIGGIEHAGPTVITSNTANDVLTLLCVKEDQIFMAVSSNTAALIDAGFTPVNYTPIDGSVKGNLQGIDNALAALADMYEFVPITDGATYEFVNNKPFIANNSGGVAVTALPASPVIKDNYGITGGSSTSWTIAIGAGQTLRVGPANYAGPTTFTSQNATDSLFFTYRGNGVFLTYLSNNGLNLVSGYQIPNHYFPVNFSIAGHFQGLDDALLNVADTLTTVYVNVNSGEDGGNANGSLLYPYKTPNYAMSQITPDSSNRYVIRLASGVYNGSDGNFALKPYTYVVGENVDTVIFTNAQISIDNSWNSVVGVSEINNISVLSGNGFLLNSTSLGSAEITITFNNIVSVPTFNYYGRIAGSDIVYFNPRFCTNVLLDSTEFYFQTGTCENLTATSDNGSMNLFIRGNVIVGGPLSLTADTNPSFANLTAGTYLNTVTVGDVAATLRVSAGATFFSNFGVEDGATFELLTEANQILAGFNPDNYTPTSDTVEGHLEGIDDALAGGTPTVNPWESVSASAITLIENIYYKFTNASGCVATLPITSAENSENQIAIANNNADGTFYLIVNAGQTLIINDEEITPAPGQIMGLKTTTDTQNQSLSILTKTANTIFQVIDTFGTWESFLIEDVGFWGDGNDPAATGVAPSNGTSISQFTDKSGYARNFFQPAGGLQWTFNTGLQNGLGGLSGSGTQYMEITSDALTSTLGSGYSQVVVMRQASGVDSAAYWAVPDDTSNRLIGIFRDADSSVYIDYGDIFSGGRLITSEPGFVGNTYLHGLVVDTGNSELINYRDGVELDTGVLASTFTPGSKTGQIGPLNGFICEILVLDAPQVLDANHELIKMLAVKWGITL